MVIIPHLPLFPFLGIILNCFCFFPAAATAADRLDEFLAATHDQVGKTLFYDPAYKQLPYPGGDIPISRGVCSDVVVRAFRRISIDLQKDVHEDMKRHFPNYPKNWGLKRPDKNIDHRRVYNLMCFFQRKAWKVDAKKTAFQPGDLVAWRLDNGLPHIGIVTEKKSLSNRFLVVHNIGAGAQLEDILDEWPVIGHYRWNAK